MVNGGFFGLLLFAYFYLALRKLLSEIQHLHHSPFTIYHLSQLLSRLERIGRLITGLSKHIRTN